MNALEALDNALDNTGMAADTNTIVVLMQNLRDEGYYLAPIGSATVTPSRPSDPATSHKAERAIVLKAGSQRWLLLSAFYRYPESGLTDEEAMEVSEGVSFTSEYAKRCSELRQAGWIRATGETRRGNSGADRIVSKITPKGTAAIGSLR